MTKQELLDLKVIFSDATIIDVDFSGWDNYVSIFVDADHFKTNITDSLVTEKFVELRFCGVEHVEFNFFHYLESYTNDENFHMVWLAYKSEMSDVDGLYFSSFSGSANAPITKISFKTVEILELNNDRIKAINPFYSTLELPGLIRPSIKDLYSIKRNERLSLFNPSENREKVSGEIKDELDQLFLNSKILDLDFSRWYKCIKITCKTDDYLSDDGTYSPYMEIFLFDVVKFFYSGRKDFKGSNVLEIKEFQLDNGDKTDILKLDCINTAELIIKFNDIYIRELDTRVVKHLNPTLSDSQFIRPTIRELMR